jgi:hypothetical protein
MEEFFFSLQTLFYHFPGEKEESHGENYGIALHDPSVAGDFL